MAVVLDPAKPFVGRSTRVRRRLVPLSFALVALARTHVLAVVPHVVIDAATLAQDTFCRIGVGDDPSTLPQVGALSLTPVTASDGETGFEGRCGIADTFFFGAGLSQYFAADAAATSIAVGKVGVLRAYGAALAETYPEAYGPPFPAEGTNILSASATALTSAFFVDEFTPPPTSTAPNPGDPTEFTLQPVLDVDCAHYQNAYQQASLVISFWTADTYTDDADENTPGFLYSTGIMRPGIPGLTNCHYGLDPRTVTGLHVGQPIAMRLSFGVTPFMSLLASQNQFGSFLAELSALGTATALLTTTDGDPVTGASGHPYVAVDPLPDLTVPTTTTTTLPSPTTTTTLPGCGGACGNGSLEPACGEACDCPATADPIVGAFGCTGATALPAQPDCVVCRGCQLLSFCPPSTTTSTTLPGGTTSTTTSATTTTTLPPPCAGLAGVAHARCELGAALAGPLCGGNAVPPAVDKALRAKLGAANGALSSLSTASGKKAKKLRKLALRDLRAAGARAGKAAKAKNAAHRISTSCAATIATLTGDVTRDLSAP